MQNLYIYLNFIIIIIIIIIIYLFIYLFIYLLLFFFSLNNSFNILLLLIIMIFFIIYLYTYLIIIFSKPKRNVVSHIFNGKVFSGNIIYQLCDLSDPKLKKIVNTKKGLIKVFNVSILFYIIILFIN